MGGVSSTQLQKVVGGDYGTYTISMNHGKVDREEQQTVVDAPFKPCNSLSGGQMLYWALEFNFGLRTNRVDRTAMPDGYTPRVNHNEV
jgi:hypothetical protein